MVETLMIGTTGAVSTTLVAVDSNLPVTALRPNIVTDLFKLRSIILENKINPKNNFFLGLRWEREPHEPR